MIESINPYNGAIGFMQVHLFILLFESVSIPKLF